jgi:large-conductance mechanosensitive channel
MSALIGARSLYSSFMEWILAFGVIGTASGTLIGNAVTELAKAIAADVVVPVSTSIMTGVMPTLDMQKLIEAVSQFVIMILLAYSFAISIGLQKARPVSLVKVVS